MKNRIAIHVPVLTIFLFFFALISNGHSLAKDRQTITSKSPSTDSRSSAPSEAAITNSLKMTFVKVPAGSYLMGSGISPSEVVNMYGGQKSWYEEELPQHKVTLTDPYYMQTHEVTVGQWRSFVDDTDYKTEAETNGGATVLIKTTWQEKKGHYWDKPGFEQTENHPVTCISWNDACAFARWLSNREGRTYRLPYEAEWEYACRAGSADRFCFGNNLAKLGTYAWYWNNSERHPHPVGQKKPNSWGLFDVHGNVWEWCLDWHAKYPEGPVTNPEGPASGSAKIYRGGSAYSHPRFCRSAFRGGYQPDGRFSSLGFRLVLIP